MKISVEINEIENNREKSMKQTFSLRRSDWSGEKRHQYHALEKQHCYKLYRHKNDNEEIWYTTSCQ